jgi:hypothetical protein
MTQDHYAAFGIVVHLTSQLDATLDQIIVAMANAATQPTFYPLLTFLSAKDKRDYIVAIAKVAQWPPYAIKGMGGLRNDIAHCLWKKGVAKGPLSPSSSRPEAQSRYSGLDTTRGNGPPLS